LQVEVWVHVAEAQSLILDCKEYYAPIVTPYEAWLAFQDLDLDPAKYRMDLACLDEPVQTRCALATEVVHSWRMLLYSAMATLKRPGVAALTNGLSIDMVMLTFPECCAGVACRLDSEQGNSEETQLAVQANQALNLSATATDLDKALIQPRTASEYLLLKRTYMGVETPAVGSAVKAVEGVQAGRAGRAAEYTGEGS
jgi:diphthamide biosynthesis protein 2